MTAERRAARGHGPWIPPPIGRRDVSRLCGTPAARLVRVEWRARLHHGIDDPPGFLDIVLPGEERAISRERIAQDAHIAITLGGARMAAREELHHLSLPTILPVHDVQPDRDLGLRIQADSYVVRRRLERKDPRRAAQPHDHLSAGRSE